MRTMTALFALAISVAGCTSTDGDDELLVFAAASLTEAFGALETAFEADHPDVDVVIHLAGSQRLAAQILEGAPAEVFASADEVQMARVVAAGEARAAPRVFAHNRLVVVVPAGNPRGVAGLADLAREDLSVVLAAGHVPAGAYTREVLDRAGVEVEPVSLELDVRSVVSRIALGEADAGVVYTSDLVGEDEVVGIEVPDELNVTADYPIVVLDDAGTAADRFVELVLSDRGRGILEDAGLRVP